MKILYRPQKIVIDTPKMGNSPWILVTVQKVTLDDDGNVTQSEDRYDLIYKPLEKHVLEMGNFFDPITNQQVQISLYGLAEGIREFVGIWMKEKYGGETYKGGSIVIE